MTGAAACALAALFTLVAMVTIAGCGNRPAARQCMTMGEGPLATAAARLRVDIYPAGVACDGIAASAGSGAPSSSMTFAQGAPIALDLSPGHHTVVLTAFSDAAGTIVIGGACTDADFQPGQAVCLDLTLAPAPDGGADLQSRVDLSIDLGMDLSVCQGAACPCTAAPDDSCGPGQFCDSDARCTPGCKSNADCTALPDGGVSDGGALTTPICDTSRHTCVECLAQSDCPLGKLCSASGFCVDGCDPNVGKGCAAGSTCCNKLCVNLQSDISNCGGCGRACATTGVVTARCSSGLCSSTCTSGAGNCIKPAAPTPDDGCETNIGTNVDNCGGCGRACSATHVSTRQCSAGLCTSSCASGFGNCSTPAAPTADDGCETNITSDASHCNSCINMCAAPPNAAPLCSSSMCTLGACNAGFQNCDATASNGCECAGTGCCGSGCQTKHNDGLGEAFYDCAASSTFNATEAMAACAAHTGDATLCSSFQCKPQAPSTTVVDGVVCDNNGKGTTCHCWDYSIAGQTGVAPGSVDNACLCPYPGETPMWN